jgi:gamma-glutamylcyclotransferase (GGCT)/AIG2-like uncharacterized protein YtfP
VSARPGPRYLFVYGTLRPGHAPAAIAAQVGKLLEVGPGAVRGRVYDLGPYPGAVLDASAGTMIEGTVFRLPADPSVLAALDAYEGFDPTDRERSLFVRARTSVTLADGRRLACWVYVYNREETRPRAPDLSLRGRGRSSSRAPSRRGARTR